LAPGNFNEMSLWVWYDLRCASRLSVSYRVAEPNLCPATQVERQRFPIRLRVRRSTPTPCRCRGTGYETAGSCQRNTVAAGSVRFGDRLVR